MSERSSSPPLVPTVVPLVLTPPLSPLHTHAPTRVQITEIKEAVELPLTHPELYVDIGIKPPKVIEMRGDLGVMGGVG